MMRQYGGPGCEPIGKYVAARCERMCFRGDAAIAATS